MVGKSLRTRIGAAAIAAAMAFSTLSATLPGNVAFAEELTTSETDEAVERITVSGNIIGCSEDETFDLEFWCYYYDDEDEEHEDIVVATVKDGKYSVELIKNCVYSVAVLGRDDIYVKNDADDEKIRIYTWDEDDTFDIEMAAVNQSSEEEPIPDEDEYITISGNIIGYTYDAPFEIMFDTWGYRDDEHPPIYTVAQDGKYSAKLRKNYSYIVRLPGADGYCLYDDEDTGIHVLTDDEDIERDITIQMINVYIDGEIYYPDIDDVDEEEFIELCSGCVINFESEGHCFEKVLSDDMYSFSNLPIGEYTVTLKGKTGNVYSVKPLSLHRRNEGYVDYFDLAEPYEYATTPSYGDYRTRDNEARIVCSFEDTLGLDLSDATFYFVDSDNNRTNDCSYLELKYGLIRLPKDKTYKLVASGLPEGYELDYGKMSSICPLQEHCGDGRYDYTVAIRKVEPYKPLVIVNDTEDIVAKNHSKCTFTIEAEGTGLKYSWYCKKPGADKFTKAGVYTNEYTRTASKSTDGLQVYCMVTDASGKKAHGRVATFSLDKQIEISYPNGKNLSATKGKKVDFMIYASPDLKLSYSWYCMKPKNSVGDGKFHKAGCYTDTYTRTAGNKIDGMQAYCLITDSTGQQVKSDVITFTLK